MLPKCLQFGRAQLRFGQSGLAGLCESGSSELRGM